MRELGDGMIDLDLAPDADVAAANAARWTAGRLAAAVHERGRACVAFSGGSTAKALFDSLLGIQHVPWQQIDVFQVDERVAPDGDPDRNARVLLAELAAPAAPLGLPASGVHLMPVTEADLDAAARRYERELQAACAGVFDVVHLGLGDDGHTASWAPNDPVIEVDDRDVALTAAPFNGRYRMTLTVPCVNRARHVMFFVVGAAKAAMVARLLDGDPAIPAGRVRRDNAVAFVDAAAMVR